MDLILLVGIVAAVLVLGALYVDARRSICSECARPFAIFPDGRCATCWRRRRVIRISRRGR